MNFYHIPNERLEPVLIVSYHRYAIT